MCLCSDVMWWAGLTDASSLGQSVAGRPLGLLRDPFSVAEVREGVRGTRRDTLLFLRLRRTRRSFWFG